MSRSFLTGLNLNKNELLNARIQNLAIAPGSPATGQIYYNTGDNTLRYWNGTAWLTLAQGGSVEQAIQAAIDALTTSDIEEGTNLYFTDQRAKDAAAVLLTGASQTNISITGDGNGLTITAENGVADSTTDDLDEGTTNLYFTDERAQDAVGNSVGNGLTYNDTTGAISASIGTGLEFNAGVIDVDTDTIATRLYADTKVSDHNNLTSGVHGVTGNVVGDTDAQTITNKTLGSGTVLSATVDANGNTITDLGTPVADTDAATKLYVDTGIQSHSNIISGIHGVTGNIVGTTDTQTLENKALSTGTIFADTIDADGYNIVNLAAPINDGDAANKAYVDNAVAGLTWKPSANLLSVSDVPLTGLTETLIIDGHAALDSADSGYRILLTNQTVDSENGIYVYTDDGTNYVLTRAVDADTYTELDGATIFIQEGTTYGQSAWTQANHYLISFEGQEWVQFSGAAQITAGNGLTKTGNTIDAVGTADRISVTTDSIDIASTYAGQTSITTLGTITSGTWEADTIAVIHGGTGATTAADARANLGATTKYTGTNPELVPVSGAVTWVVAHNMGIRTVVVQVYALDTFEQVEVDVERTNTNEVTLSWVSTSTILADSYQVVVVG